MARAERTEKCHFLESEEESFALFNSTPLSSFSEYGLGEWLLVYIEKQKREVCQILGIFFYIPLNSFMRSTILENRDYI